MADLIQMLIEVLRIDCSVVNCYYTNQIDAIFNLFFFPTVFILLVIYLLLNYILDEVKGGLRLLISIALYAVIILNGFMTFFIPLSQFWWITLLIVFGAWVFFTRLLFKEKNKGGGSGGLAGFMSGAAGGVAAGFLSDAVKGDKSARLKEIEQQTDVLAGIAKKAKSEGKLPGDASYAGFTTQFRNEESNVRGLMQSYVNDYYSHNLKIALKDGGFKKAEEKFTKIIKDFNR